MIQRRGNGGFDWGGGGSNGDGQFIWMLDTFWR